jgi:hypothetical protein
VVEAVVGGMEMAVMLHLWLLTRRRKRDSNSEGVETRWYMWPLLER